MSLNQLAFCGVALGAFGGGLLAWISFILLKRENENRYRCFIFLGFFSIVLGFVLQALYYGTSLQEWFIAIVAVIVVLGFISSWFSIRRKRNAHHGSIPKSSNKQIGQYINLSRDELWRQLGNAIHLRSAQDQVLWSIFGVFWAANAILLVALFPQGHIPKYCIGMIISVVGILLLFVWHKIQNRALGNVERYEELMKKLEQQQNLGIPPELAISGEINPDYDKFLGKGMRARKLMPTCSLVAAILWVLAFLFFFVKLVCPAV